MSGANLGFTVSPVEANLNVTTNEINFTPSAVNMTVFAGGIGTPAGGVSGNSQVQYNNNGVLGGNSQFTYYAPSATLSVGGNLEVGNEVVATSGLFDGNVNVSALNASYKVATSVLNVTTEANLGPVANLTITGGTNGQFLRTDGAGQITFSTITLPTPGGANTALQYNDNGEFAGVYNAYFDNVNNKLVLGSNAQVSITGGINGQYLQTDGNGTMLWANAGGTGGTPGGTNTQVQFNNAGSFAGNVNLTYDYVSGVLSTRSLTLTETFTAPSVVATSVSTGNLTATGTTSVQQAKEKVTIVATAPTGTLQYDVLSQAITYYTSNIAGNIVVNVRGNATTTFDSITSIGESTTLVLLTKTGASIYIPTGLTIDGTSVTPKWVAKTAPALTNITANTITAYSYTVIKTAANTYTALASFSGYA